MSKYAAQRNSRHQLLNTVAVAHQKVWQGCPALLASRCLPQPKAHQDANACNTSSDRLSTVMGWAVLLLLATAPLVVGAEASACPLVDAAGCCGSQCRIGLCTALYSFGEALVSHWTCLGYDAAQHMQLHSTPGAGMTPYSSGGDSKCILQLVGILRAKLLSGSSPHRSAQLFDRTVEGGQSARQVLAVCMPIERVPAQAGLLLKLGQATAEEARSVSRALKATRLGSWPPVLSLPSH